jgi:hypothetical protein
MMDEWRRPAGPLTESCWLRVCVDSEFMFGRMVKLKHAGRTVRSTTVGRMQQMTFRIDGNKAALNIGNRNTI